MHLRLQDYLGSRVRPNPVPFQEILHLIILENMSYCSKSWQHWPRWGLKSPGDSPFPSILFIHVMSPFVIFPFAEGVLVFYTSPYFHPIRHRLQLRFVFLWFLLGSNRITQIIGCVFHTVPFCILISLGHGIQIRIIHTPGLEVLLFPARSGFRRSIGCSTRYSTRHSTRLTGCSTLLHLHCYPLSIYIAHLPSPDIVSIISLNF